MRLLRYGLIGNDVLEWQKVLVTSGYAINLSGIFDGPTHNATMSWQKERSIEVDGVVGNETIGKIGSPAEHVPIADLNIKFKQAKNYTIANRTDIRWIVLHSMEAAEASLTAENVASWFASPNAPNASAHYNVDCDSIVQSVKDTDIAWHAKGGNKYGIGIEMAGRAKQTRNEWIDEYGQSMFKILAKLIAHLCIKHNIPAQYIDYNDVKKYSKGITTHNDITKAFNIVGGHYDPGPYFPIDVILNMANEIIIK